MGRLEDIIGAVAALLVVVVGLVIIWKRAGKRKYDPDELVVVAHFGNENEAQIWKMRLKSNGIECMIYGANSQRFIAFGPDSGIRLAVRAADAPHAAKLLGEKSCIEVQTRAD